MDNSTEVLQEKNKKIERPHGRVFSLMGVNEEEKPYLKNTHAPQRSLQYYLR